GVGGVISVHSLSGDQDRARQGHGQGQGQGEGEGARGICTGSVKRSRIRSQSAPIGHFVFVLYSRRWCSGAGGGRAATEAKTRQGRPTFRFSKEMIRVDLQTSSLEKR